MTYPYTYVYDLTTDEFIVPPTWGPTSPVDLIDDDCPEPPMQSASETYLEYLFRNTINHEANK